jgi:hypothetical protein
MSESWSGVYPEKSIRKKAGGKEFDGKIIREQ